MEYSSYPRGVGEYCLIRTGLSIWRSGDTELHLWLADNGNFGAAPEKFDVYIAFEDGRLLKNTIKVTAQFI